MLVSVHAISATGGHCDDQNGMRPGLFGYESGPEQGVINGPVEARKAVRHNVKYGADVIKVCATGGVLSLTDPPDVAQLTQDELNAIVEEAHTLRKKTAAHAHFGLQDRIRTGGGVVYFLNTQLGVRVPSTAMVALMTERFVNDRALRRAEGINLVTFEKGERKDDVARRYLAAFGGEEGVLFIGKAQEKTSVSRTEKRRDAPGKTYPWIIRSAAMPSQYYVYILDRDFGPLFIKFCSYFPTRRSSV